MTIPADWRRLALDPPRATGAPLGTGQIRTEPGDFRVDEQLGFAPGGEGPHALIRVRKKGANTDWVAREIAREAGVRAFDVGFAGLKDRHAVTTQWFTVPRGKREPASWVGMSGEGYEILEAHAHQRKLPRGALAGNRFEIVIRGVSTSSAEIEARLAAIARDGVPNYFGPQRFGRDVGNLYAVANGKLEARQRYALSATRGLVFNAVLAARVSDGTWNRLRPGDVANLDGTGSVFDVAAVDAELERRIGELDVHPTGPLYGRGRQRTSGDVTELEAEVYRSLGTVCAQLEAAGLDASRRALRVAVRDLRGSLEGDRLTLAFALTSGSFATTVLREILDVSGVEQGDADD